MSTIPEGYCQCGCGSKTKISPSTSTAKGWVKGQPRAYINGHNNHNHKIMSVAEYRARWTARTNVPYGYCHCGCGHKTNVAGENSSKYGHVKGEPLRYISGHNTFGYGQPYYLVEDRGYQTPCWIWQRYIDEQGYGTTRDNGRMQKAHRVYYESRYGEIPSGLQLDHLCRVRSCVNPDHLQPVTGVENVHRGERCELTAVEVQAIRILDSKGAKRADMSRTFGVSETTLSSIIHRETWVDV